MNPGICYLYEYKNDQKLRNVGFMKVTPHYRTCILQINVRGIPVKNQDSVSLLTFYEEDSGIIAKHVETLPCGDKSIYARLSVDDSSYPDGRTLADLGGFLLKTETGQYYAAFTDNLTFNTASIRMWEAAQEPVMEAESVGVCPCILDNDEKAVETTESKDAGMSEVSPEPEKIEITGSAQESPMISESEQNFVPASNAAQEIIPDSQPFPVWEANPDNNPYPAQRGPIQRGGTSPDQSVPRQDNALQNENNTDWNDYSENMKPSDRENYSESMNNSNRSNNSENQNNPYLENDPQSEFESDWDNTLENGSEPDLVNYPGNENFPNNENDFNRDSTSQSESFPVPEYMPEDTPVPYSVRESQPAWEPQMMQPLVREPQAIQPSTREPQAIQPPTREQRTMQPPANEPQAMQPSTHEPQSSPSLPQESQPQQATAGTARKIQRSDLSILPRRCWNLANNSFLMHGYHNYKHLLLVEEDGHFWLGVPGIYAPREARAAELFGFPQFTQTYTSQLELSDDECEESEKFGYWCRFIR